MKLSVLIVIASVVVSGSTSGVTSGSASGVTSASTSEVTSASTSEVTSASTSGVASASTSGVASVGVPNMTSKGMGVSDMVDNITSGRGESVNSTQEVASGGLNGTVQLTNETSLTTAVPPKMLIGCDNTTLETVGSGGNFYHQMNVTGLSNWTTIVWNLTQDGITQTVASMIYPNDTSVDYKWAPNRVSVFFRMAFYLTDVLQSDEGNYSIWVNFDNGTQLCADSVDLRVTQPPVVDRPGFLGEPLPLRATGWYSMPYNHTLMWCYRAQQSDNCTLIMDLVWNSTVWNTTKEFVNKTKVDNMGSLTMVAPTSEDDGFYFLESTDGKKHNFIRKYLSKFYRRLMVVLETSGGYDGDDMCRIHISCGDGHHQLHNLLAISTKLGVDVTVWQNSTRTMSTYNDSTLMLSLAGGNVVCTHKNPKTHVVTVQSAGSTCSHPSYQTMVKYVLLMVFLVMPVAMMLSVLLVHCLMTGGEPFSIPTVNFDWWRSDLGPAEWGEMGRLTDLPPDEEEGGQQPDYFVISE